MRSAITGDTSAIDREMGMDLFNNSEPMTAAGTIADFHEDNPCMQMYMHE